MSYFMDYGPDWPPAPAPEPPGPSAVRVPLWKQAAVRVGVILATWAVCALLLHLVAPDAGMLKFERPREGSSRVTPAPAHSGR